MLTNSSCVELNGIGSQIKDLTSVSNAITSIIAEEPPALYKEGGYIRAGYNAELDRLRNIKEDGKNYIRTYEMQERERTGIKNLKVGYNRVFGYYIEVNKQYSDLVPAEYVRKQTISNNERYITEELKNYENEVLTSTERALKLEEQLYDEFKQSMMQYCADLQQLASLISQVDCFYSLSCVAVDNNYCKPEMVNKTFRMPAELVERLNIVAQEQKVSLNNLVCQCCEYALNNMSEKVDNKE